MLSHTHCLLNVSQGGKDTQPSHLDCKGSLKVVLDYNQLMRVHHSKNVAKCWHILGKEQFSNTEKVNALVKTILLIRASKKMVNNQNITPCSQEMCRQCKQKQQLGREMTLLQLHAR